MKKVLKVLLIVAILTVLFTFPVYAQGGDTGADAGGIDSIFTSLKASVALAGAITLILQVGKLFLPKVFPDNSLETWRTGLVLVISVFLFLGPTFGLFVSMEMVDKYAQTLSQIGVSLMPLFVWLSDWLSKMLYQKVLRGRKLIGKSYSMDKIYTNAVFVNPP